MTPHTMKASESANFKGLLDSEGGESSQFWLMKGEYQMHAADLGIS